MVCPKCGYTAYPKLSPAVIVLVTKGDKILLQRNTHYRDTCKTREGQRPRCPSGGKSRAARTLPLPNLQGFASASHINAVVRGVRF